MQQTEGVARFDQHPITHRIARASPDDGAARVEWEDGRTSTFHWAWLRDNCTCPDCFHPETLERTVDILSWPADIHPERFALGDDGALHVTWSDGGHVSRYGPGWLRAHCYSDDAVVARHRTRRLWDRDLADGLPTLPHAEIAAGDAGVLRWLRLLREYGVALVRGVPCEEGAVRRVAERIGPVRETNFGDIFDVVSMPKPNSNAYTALTLPLHTDLPYREQEPGYQFLHCLQNEATGGESVLADGFSMAAALRESDPAAFDILCRPLFNFGYLDEAVDYRLRVPVIGLDDAGEITEIRFNQATAKPFDLPGDRMPQAYRAWRAFAALTRDPRFQLQFRLEAGDMISFDNRRVLHARTAFDPSSGRRHLQGCYVEREEADCRIRVLERIPAEAAE